MTSIMDMPVTTKFKNAEHVTNNKILLTLSYKSVTQDIRNEYRIHDLKF